MTLCTSSMPGGINIDCLSYPSPVVNVIITDSDIVFTEAEFKLLSEWKTMIQEDLSVWIPSMAEGYDSSTPDPTINTTQTGRQVMTNKPPPSGVFYLRTNICDYNEVMRGLDSQTKRVFFVLADGTIVGYRSTTANEVMGFQAEVNAFTKGIPSPDAIENSFPLYINFMNYFEFENQYAYEPDWGVQAELPSAMPQSYSMRFISGVQATATIVCYIYERCGDAAAGLVIADIEVISDTLTDATVTAVTDNSDGTWDIVFTTAAMNQDITFRVKELTGSVVDGVSNPVYHEFIA